MCIRRASGRAEPGSQAERPTSSGRPALRVLLASWIADNRWTGMGRWTHEVAKGLRAQGHEVDTWFADSFPALRGAGRLAVLLAPLALASRAFRARRRFDVLLVHESFAFWVALLARAAPGMPRVVAMCHNVESHYQAQMRAASRRGLASVTRWSRVKTTLFRRWQSDGAIRLAAGVVCLSALDRAWVIERLGRAPGSVVALTNGVDAGAFVPGEGDRSRVLFVGGWLDVKGRRLLPKIWRNVRERAPLRLTLVGTGVPEEAVGAEFDPRDRGSVTVIPRVEDTARVAALVREHGILLMPSLSEGSPLALLEAMAAGLVPVAARVGGIPDIVRHEREGLLFDTDDPDAAARAVALAARDADLSARLVRGARTRAEALTWSATARALSAALSEVVEEAPAGASAREHP